MRSGDSSLRSGVDDLNLLGQGAESAVYELDADTVLRVSKSRDDMRAHFLALKELYEAAAAAVGFRVPGILAVGTVGGRTASIERRIPGRPMSSVLLNLDGPDRQRLLLGYLGAAARLSDVVFPERPYGELLTDRPLTDDTWPGFVTNSLAAALEQHSPALAALSFDERARERLAAVTDTLPRLPPKAMVHGDFFPGNVMVGSDLEITGVIDIGHASLVGDSQVDLAGSLMWLEVVAGYRAQDSAFLRRVILTDHRVDERLLDFYRVFYSIKYAGTQHDDPNLYAWCAGNLRAWARP